MIIQVVVSCNNLSLWFCSVDIGHKFLIISMLKLIPNIFISKVKPIITMSIVVILLTSIFIAVYT